MWVFEVKMEAVVLNSSPDRGTGSGEKLEGWD